MVSDKKSQAWPPQCNPTRRESTGVGVVFNPRHKCIRYRSRRMSFVFDQVTGEGGDSANESCLPRQSPIQVV